MSVGRIRNMLGWYAREEELSPLRVQALSALYIGDRLEELAQAIDQTAALPPTEADLDKEAAASGPPAPHKQCGNCQHWIMGINITGRFAASCDYATAPVLMIRLDGRCTGFVEREQ